MGARPKDPVADYKMGPGYYNSERADPLVKRGDIYTDFAKRTTAPFK